MVRGGVLPPNGVAMHTRGGGKSSQVLKCQTHRPGKNSGENGLQNKNLGSGTGEKKEQNHKDFQNKQGSVAFQVFKGSWEGTWEGKHAQWPKWSRKTQFLGRKKFFHLGPARKIPGKRVAR